MRMAEGAGEVAREGSLASDSACPAGEREQEAGFAVDGFELIQVRIIMDESSQPDVDETIVRRIESKGVP